MIWQIRHIVFAVEPSGRMSGPTKAVHWFGRIGPYHAWCGTFGHGQFHADDPGQVTCSRCKHKMEME